jgi:two-component system OmpR family response regulator
MRVLIVEDDLMIGEAVQVALKNASYAADWVKDGPTALDAANSQNYDLILLDLGLPGKDGLDVLTRIRAKGNSVSLLIITARDGLMTECAGWTAARMTMCSSPSRSQNFWLVCAPFCGARAGRRFLF